MLKQEEAVMDEQDKRVDPVEEEAILIEEPEGTECLSFGVRSRKMLKFM